MSAAAKLRAIVRDNRAGLRRALPSWCTAHPDTLRAIIAAYREDDEPILIEATCNQVNQEGGYTGMTPAAFRTFAEGLMERGGRRSRPLDPRRRSSGPQSLAGPSGARSHASRRPISSAPMSRRASSRSISTPACAARTTERFPRPRSRNAQRNFARRPRKGRDGSDLAYVIGTEVPIPGGETEALDALAVTPADNVRRTIDLHRAGVRRARHSRRHAVASSPSWCSRASTSATTTSCSSIERRPAGWSPP